MSETGRPHRGARFGRAVRVGDDALRFMRWYAGGKYALMEGFLGELDDPPEARDPADVRERFCRAVAHGRRVAAARALVTVLLAMGVATAALAAAGNALWVPASLEGDVLAMRGFLARLAAWSATFSVLLVALRLAFDRYLELVDVSATFLAMQLATTRPPARERA